MLSEEKRLKRNNYARKWRVENPEKWSAIRNKKGAKDKQRDSYLKNRYGLSLENYEKMLFEQEGRCWICRQSPEETKAGFRLGVDHCHRSDKVRGLLCLRCNQVLGYSSDSVSILKKAIAYIEKNSSTKEVD